MFSYIIGTLRVRETTLNIYVLIRFHPAKPPINTKSKFNGKINSINAGAVSARLGK